MSDQQTAAPCESRLYDFYRIPDGSTAELWVEGEEGAFVVSARVRTQDSSDTLSHGSLYRRPGAESKAEVPLRAPSKYVITLWLHFKRQTTVTIQFRIAKPAGSSGPRYHSSTPIRCSVTAEEGTEDDRAFTLFTARTAEA